MLSEKFEEKLMKAVGENLVSYVEEADTDLFDSVFEGKEFDEFVGGIAKRVMQEDAFVDVIRTKIKEHLQENLHDNIANFIDDGFNISDVIAEECKKIVGDSSDIKEKIRIKISEALNAVDWDSVTEKLIQQNIDNDIIKEYISKALTKKLI